MTQCPRPVDPQGRWHFAPCPSRLLQKIRFYQVKLPGGAQIVLPPPVASTDGVNFDRQPTPEERAALPAYRRKL